MRVNRSVWVSLSLGICISLLSSGCDLDLKNIKFKGVDELAQDKADRHQAKKDASLPDAASPSDLMDDPIDEDDVTPDMLASELEEQTSSDPRGSRRPAPTDRPTPQVRPTPPFRPTPDLRPSPLPGGFKPADGPGSEPPSKLTDVSAPALLAPGTFVTPAKIQITLLSEGGVKSSVSGTKNPLADVSNIKWILDGGQLEFRDANGTVAFYRIQDKDTFVGPIAKKTGLTGRRTTISSASHVVFTRVVTLNSAFREFTDSTGQFKIRAKFIDYQKGKAHLQKDDGKVVTLLIEKLSGPDQAYIRAEIKKRQ